ncbi:threo-3-hydroxy-L-aspartate ammonia-lyase [Acinetobacter sp. MD2(2019)]|uniref:threo-3-hydroxy-L-aspartate ammonia-lyase n=1 Tax=Acinetobacter sp. MD2(2019) TaxID=2605273 RepID=UPI002D1ED9B4|nr:threo-3-hydroxy-L-aspartate ammonia-lyase [Acinetobacter sp. MD2(2019)]MEB3754876.1 threo-3-hydroxy-L-aspartate ammonia-lyase [Acinetobacter sp. MD2(2019)]
MDTNATTCLPSFEDVVDAEQRINGVVHRTAVLQSHRLNQKFSAEIFFKCENLQRTGSFKFRGAFNALSKLNAAQRKQGVIAFSSGNHAQGIALAAKLLNISATIVMPEDAPTIKISATQAYGANIVFYNRYTQNREQIASQLALEQGRILIPAYDHADIIAGQGTVAKELIADVGHLDFLFVGLGGGGLLSGSLLAAQALLPQCKVIGVEPELGNDAQQSLHAGRIIHIDTPNTIADGAQTQHLGQLTFPIIQQHVHQIATVSDSALVQSLQFFAQTMKIVVEPTACLGLAVLSQWANEIRGKRVGIILTGGNVDLAQYAQYLSQPVAALLD